MIINTKNKYLIDLVNDINEDINKYKRININFNKIKIILMMRRQFEC